MTCPHCQASITRKQRSNLVCSLCNKEFAFDPKGNALGLHDLRFRKVAERMGLEGMKFTARQLRVALTRPTTSTLNPVWVGVVLLVVGAVLLAGFGSTSTKMSPAMPFGIAMLVAGILFTLIGLFSASKTVTDESFRDEFLERWRRLYQQLPAGLITDPTLPDLTSEDRPRENLVGVLVCPERDVLISLLANRVPRELRIGLMGLTPPFDPWETDLLELLRQDPQLPVLLLHDASAEGVFLARDLPASLGLSPSHRIFDLGLNAKKSIAKKRTVVVQPVTEAMRNRLDAEPVGADVEATRPLRRGRAQVTPEELAWLKVGSCSPILAVPPGALVKRLKFALTKLPPRGAAARPPVDGLAGVGFLTWPA